MKVNYCSKNPIITSESVPKRRDNFVVIGAFNPGVAIYNGETLLLVRVAERVNGNSDKVYVPIADNNGITVREFDKADNSLDFSDVRVIKRGDEKFLTSMSILMVATSSDGVNFTFYPDRVIEPRGEYETFGIEDARITLIGDIYYVNYSAISPFGICTTLVTTKDFITFNKVGNILCPDNKDAAIFPEKIDGKYYMLHRPSKSDFTAPEIWIAESCDLLHWGNHRRVMGVRNGSWDGARIGSSSVPIKLKEGWLFIYHGADNADRYCLGAALVDLHDPQKLIARSDIPFMQPINSYEKDGFLKDVVFACGCTKEGDILHIYYGAADCCICLADVCISDILKSLRYLKDGGRNYEFN